MTDATVIETPAIKRRTVRRRRKVPVEAKPRPNNDLAGITATTCPTACTAERCVISTIGVCKHPKLSPANGCGPVTIANRARAEKVLKRQALDRS